MYTLREADVWTHKGTEKELHFRMASESRNDDELDQEESSAPLSVAQHKSFSGPTRRPHVGSAIRDRSCAEPRPCAAVGDGLPCLRSLQRAHLRRALSRFPQRLPDTCDPGFILGVM